MRRTGNKDENKRILMDLDVVLKSHDCPYIIQCYGAIVTNVSLPQNAPFQILSVWRKLLFETLFPS